LTQPHPRSGIAPAATAQTPAPPQRGPAAARWHRFRLGTFEITTLMAGERVTADPRATYGLNASAEAFAALAAENFLPTDRLRSSFTPTLVHTGAELVLFDTGLEAAGLAAALAEADLHPGQIDLVVLTHLHPDHVGGLTDAAGAAFFPRARYAAGRIEHAHWAAQDNPTLAAQLAVCAGKLTLFDDGETLVPGITALHAPGHTPGHMVFRLESAGAVLMLTADTANHYVFSLHHPEWEVRFDVDKAQAIATRQRILGQIAAEKCPFIGYHMPFPAVGYLEAKGPGYRFVPASYQLSLPAES
jgi:glyoxylase-like metal-dependent hydrolase (beta-lactamase superfamily II)